MKVIKRINTNAAIALDSKGIEIVILGKGVGFPQVPYELEDLTKIERSFYDINPEYMSAFGRIPENIIEACGQIMELAEVTLKCEMNPNFPITLADHYYYAILREHSQELNVSSPLTDDVEYLYPVEYELGKKALEILSICTNEQLPLSEATNTALHLINAQAESDNMHSVMMSAKIISDIYSIIEEYFERKLDRKSFQCSRFNMHLRFMIQRLEKNAQLDNKMGNLIWQMAKEYPDNYVCTQRIVSYFEQHWGWKCNQDETLYLFIHINRVTAEISNQSLKL